MVNIIWEDGKYYLSNPIIIQTIRWTRGVVIITQADSKYYLSCLIIT